MLDCIWLLSTRFCVDSFHDWLSLHSHFKLQEMNTKHREDLQQQLAKFHEVSLGAYQLLLTVRLTKSQMKS